MAVCKIELVARYFVMENMTTKWYKLCIEMLWWADESLGILPLSSRTAPTTLSAGGSVPWGSSSPLEAKQGSHYSGDLCVKNETDTFRERHI